MLEIGRLKLLVNDKVQGSGQGRAGDEIGELRGPDVDRIIYWV